MAYGPVNVGSEIIDKDLFLKNDKMGIPGGVATLDANGKLTESQRPDIDYYTKAQTDEKTDAKVLIHNADASAHGDIRSALEAVSASVKALELKYGTNITENGFEVTFSSLDGLTVSGVWNSELARIEF